MTLSITDKAKTNAKHDVETLLSRPVKECKSLLPSGFIFQHNDGRLFTR